MIYLRCCTISHVHNLVLTKIYPYKYALQSSKSIFSQDVDLILSSLPALPVILEEVLLVTYTKPDGGPVDSNAVTNLPGHIYLQFTPISFLDQGSNSRNIHSTSSGHSH